MFLQLLIGTAVVSLTIVVIAVFMGVAIAVLNRIGAWIVTPPGIHKSLLTLIGVALWLMAGLTACVWSWASTFAALGVFPGFETDLYFSVVTFTSLGYGGLTLPPEWRLLSGICTANGLLLFGLCTAFLVEFLRRLMAANADKTEANS